jgi:hypothetical protein
MKKFLMMVAVAMMTAVSANAQTFYCSDMILSSSYYSFDEIQRRKNAGLGSKATLNFYDKAVRFSVLNTTESAIFDMVSETRYEFNKTISKKKGQKIMCKSVLTLEKKRGIITSFTIKSYENNQLFSTIIFKQE